MDWGGEWREQVERVRAVSWGELRSICSGVTKEMDLLWELTCQREIDMK